jgi:putative Mg2+ transporter-C (MgtC) family protein
MGARTTPQVALSSVFAGWIPLMMDLLDVTVNLAAALALGAVIGFERQWRQRLAGLRTNTLVALGSALFVVFAGLFEDEVSPTRVAAQVVSGIGFLGAGVIFKEGLNVRGLNTAATLWCSAAVGMLAGVGALVHATIAAGLVVFVNLLLRPLVQRINRQPLETSELVTGYAVTIVSRSEQEAHTRALLLQGLASSGLHLRELDSTDIENSDRVEVSASVTADRRADAAVEQIVGRLSIEPAVTSARWRIVQLAE